ncbi:redoxin domain-containing protein [Microvirga sp. 2TAF3]|uniref:redoxin domain-containing protein n=1 Tax=Microvirga sp. 2TAF3 TaxID=3233014 RepID=UPI003F959D19
MSQNLSPRIPGLGFTFRVIPDQDISLEGSSRRLVILAFYPADWSPVCGDQMVLYSQVRSELQKYGAEILEISVNGVWFRKAFVEHCNLHFPLLADFEPKGAVAKQYETYRNKEGAFERALFFLDKNGVIF